MRLVGTRAMITTLAGGIALAGTVLLATPASASGPSCSDYMVGASNAAYASCTGYRGKVQAKATCYRWNTDSYKTVLGPWVMISPQPHISIAYCPSGYEVVDSDYIVG